MELQKGTSLNKKQISDAKCRQKWNAVRKAYAKFTDKKYIIPPVYDNSKNKTQKQPLNSTTNTNTIQNENTNTKKNKSYLSNQRNNETRKNNSQNLFKGVKRIRTIKRH